MPSKTDRKRQKRLAFTPLPSSSPASKGYDKQIRDRAAAVVLEGSPRAAKRRKMPVVVEAEEPASAIPTPPDDDVEDSDDRPVRPTQERRRAKQQRLDFSAARDPASFDPAVAVTSSPRRSRPTKAGMFSSQVQGQIGDSSSEESDDSDAVKPSQRKVLHKSSSPLDQPARRTTRSSATVIPDDEEDEIAVGIAKPMQQALEDSDDEDDMPTTMGTQRRRRQRRTSNNSFIDNSSPPPAISQKSSRRKSRQEPISDPPDSPPAAIDSDDDLVIIEQPSRKRSREVSSEEDEDEDDLPKTPRRRLKKRQVTEQEKQDLDEDLDFLRPSSDEDSRRPRDTQSAKKDARQKALAKLKQKRGQSSQMAPVEEDRENGSVDQDDDTEMIVDDDVDEDDDVPQYISSRSVFKADEEDADFLVEEEEEGPLGIPEGIPIAYTRYASMKAKELFRWAVDWFVQRKINPAFSRNDEIYDLTFRKLDDEVQGLSLSKYTSSAWKPNFVIALQARPDIAFEALDRNEVQNMFRDKCEACNRTGHPATYRLQFQGAPYHRETLDEVTNMDDDDEDDSDEDSSNSHQDKTEYDVQGREVLPATTVFYLGKFCKANAEAAHSLYHWRFHLAQTVEGYLEGCGYLTPQELAKRDKLSTKKRGKKANKIANRMEKEGETQKLWKMFRDNIDDARNAKQEGRNWAR